MDRCYNCKQELIEIENDGLQLTGCLSCNLWASADGSGYLKKISARFISCVMADIDRALTEADALPCIIECVQACAGTRLQ